LIGAGIFLCLLILIPAGILFWLETDHAREFIQTRANNAIPGSVSWEKLRFSLLGGRLELKNVLLRSPSDEELAGFDRLFVNLSWATLLKGDLTVEEVTLEKPHADLRADAQGRLNLLDAFPPSEPKREEKKSTGLPFNIVVKSLRLVHGSVRYKAQAQNLKVHVPEIHLSGEDGNFLEKSGKLTIHIRDGKVESPTINTQLRELRLDAKLEQGKLDPLVIKLDSDTARLALSGNAEDIFNEPLMSLVLDISSSLDSVRDSFSLKPVLTGDARIQLKVQGSAGNPDVRLQLDYAGGNLAGNQIDNLLLQCHLKDRLLTIRNSGVRAASGELSLEGDVDLQKAFDKGFLSSEKNLEAAAYQLSLKPDQINLAELPFNKSKKMRGIVNGDISLSGRGISPKTLSAELVLELLGEQLSTGGIASPINLSLNTRANLDQGLARVSELSAKVGDITLEGGGSFHMDSQELDANIALNAPELEANLQPLGVRDVHGNLKLSANASGSAKQPLFDLALDGKKLGFQDITVGNIRLKAVSDTWGTVRISELNLENQGSVLEGGGSIRVFQKDSLAVNPDMPLDFKLALRNVETKDFLSKIPAAGSLNGDLSIRGKAKQPLFDLALDGKKLGFQDITVGNIRLKAVSDTWGTVRISELNLENQGSVLEGRGSVQVFQKDSTTVNKAFPMDVALKLRNIEAKDFFRKVPADGALNGNLNLSGDLNQMKAAIELKAKKLRVNNMGGDDIDLKADLEGSMRQPRGKVRLQGKNLDLGVQKLSSISLKADLDGEKIRISNLGIAITPKESIQASGWVSPLDKRYDLSIRSTGIRLKSIDKVREQKIADGKITLNLSGKGSFENPGLDGDISLSGIQVRGKKLDDFRLRVSVADQIARVSGKLNFDLEGAFHLKKKDFSASLNFDETRLTPYLRLADQTDLDGILSGKIRAKGNVGAIEGIQASADLSKLNLSFEGKELVRSRNFKASFENGEISIPGAGLVLLNEGNIRIDGKGKLEGPFDIRAKGLIPLKVANAFMTDSLDLTGNVRLDARMRGTPGKPDIRADVELKKVGLTVPGLEQELSELNGRIQVTPRKVTLENIEGQMDSGKFSLSGGLDLKAFQPGAIDVKFRANALPVNVPDMLELLLNADIRLRGTPEKTSLAGEAVILEGRYYKDINLLQEGIQGIMKKKRETAPMKKSSSGGGGMQQPFLKNMSLDIALKHRNAFLVENNLAELEINPDLKVGGSLNNPLISGRAEIDTGTVIFQKKNFEVRKGVIDFLNPYKIEPTIDLESDISVREWNIVLKISGTPDQLIFKLSSDPSAEDADILSLLVMGKTTKELGKSSGGSQFPAQMLADIVQDEFGEDIRNATGLDILEVGFKDDENKDLSEQVTVTVGKKLSRRMTVKYNMESEQGEMIQKGIAEYKFLENLMLSGFQDSNGTFGGELVFRMEFR